MRVLIYGFTGKVLGGIEVFVLNMNEHMSKDCVFDYFMDGDVCIFRERVEKRGGKVFFVPWARKHPLKYISCLWNLFGKLKREGTRILYCQLFAMSNLIPGILARMRGYKVVLHAHNNGLQRNGKSDIIAHNIGKFLSKFFGFTYFTNSQLSSDFMFGKGVKSHLIYNAIDVEKFSFNPSIRETVREEMGCGDKTVIGFVGRLVYQKNPIFMLEVFAEMLKLESNCELWIIGEGELKEALEREIHSKNIESSVRWLGRRDDVDRLMQGMDLLLQPSRFEGLGIVLVEAQATGLPVVSSKTVIPQEAVISNRLLLLPLNSSPLNWAGECVKHILNCNVGTTRSDVKVPENYDIYFEAKRLEKLLEDVSLDRVEQ